MSWNIARAIRLPTKRFDCSGFLSPLISASDFQKIEATLAPNDSSCASDTDTSTSSDVDDDTHVMDELESIGSLLTSQTSSMGASPTRMMRLLIARAVYPSHYASCTTRLAPE